MDVNKRKREERGSKYDQPHITVTYNFVTENNEFGSLHMKIIPVY